MADNRLAVAHIQMVVDAGIDTIREDKFVIGRLSGHWFIGESSNFKCKRYMGKHDFEIIGSILSDSKENVEDLIEQFDNSQKDSRQVLAHAFQNNEVAKTLLGYITMAIIQDFETEENINELRDSALKLLQNSGVMISSELQQKSQHLAEFQEKLSCYFV